VIFKSDYYLFEVLLSLSKEPMIVSKLIIHKQKENFLSFPYTIISFSLSLDISQANAEMLEQQHQEMQQ